MKKSLCVLIAVFLMPLCLTITSCTQKEISWKEASFGGIDFYVPEDYELESQTEDRIIYESSGNEISIFSYDEEAFDQDEVSFLKDELGGDYEIVRPQGGYDAAHFATSGDSTITHKYAIKFKYVYDTSLYSTTDYNYYIFNISINKQTSPLDEEDMIGQFWEKASVESDWPEIVSPPDCNSPESSQPELSDRSDVVEQFRDVLGSKEIDENNGYISNSETVQATMSYWENSLLDLLRPMAAGDWSNGQSDVYVTLWAWINSSKQYYRSTVVEAYMNGETNYTIEQLGDMIEENDNELDDLFNETWETLSTAISLEYEDGIHAFIDGIEG